MTRDEWAQIVVAMRAAWPQADFGDDAQDAYYEVLADLPYGDVRMAVITSIGLSGDEMPRPGALLTSAVGGGPSARPAAPAPPAPAVDDGIEVALHGGATEAADARDQVPDAGYTTMSPRMRRLATDWVAVRSAFSGHPLVTVEPIGPEPPEKYRVTYRLKGLALQGDQPMQSRLHQCEIHLPAGYPREQPLVLPLTPIFHPNVTDRYCISDNWTAGESLMDVITRLADIIQYRSYNTHSPLNGRAAHWVNEQDPAVFPIGDDDIRLGDVPIAIKSQS